MFRVHCCCFVRDFETIGAGNSGYFLVGCVFRTALFSFFVGDLCPFWRAQSIPNSLLQVVGSIHFLRVWCLRPWLRVTHGPVVRATLLTTILKNARRLVSLPLLSCLVHDEDMPVRGKGCARLGAELRPSEASVEPVRCN